MRRWKQVAALVLPLLVIGLSPVWAEGRRVALILGNSAYQHAPPLTNPVNDARVIAESLTKAGFELIGGGAQLDLDKAGTEQAIRKFGTRLAGADVGLFYYAGHGVQVRGSNYLLPTSANLTKEADVRYELIDVNVVLEEMTIAESRLNIIILDACRNNPFGGRGLRSVGAGLAQMQAPAGTIIAYATQPGAVAADGEGANSPYTDALAKAVSKPGDTVFDVFNDVGVTVKRNTGGAQQPWVSASPIEGRFYFLGPTTVVTASTPASVPPTADKEMAFWDSVKTSSNPRLFEAYLRQFPQGTFAAIAEARITELGGNPAAARVATVPMIPTNPPAPSPVAPSPPPAVPAPTPAAPAPTVDLSTPASPPGPSGTKTQTAGLAAPPAPPPVAPLPGGPARPLDASAIPYVSSKARETLSRYAEWPSPKALAISQQGNYAYFTNRTGTRSAEDVKRSALQYCQFNAEEPCALYAVDDAVVFEGKAGFKATPVDIPGSGRFDPALVPFVSDRTREVAMANYARNPTNKAIALTASGIWAAVWGKDTEETARDAALEQCQSRSQKEDCYLYAVNGEVVFDEEH
ncbi:caspase family protein [Azospirillum griseum]|uniref:caspase family protein n=1 Tax=Azospirillum griseum TaxID=2496639 RepID=UPI001AECDCCB|nr:caspase family protein [Azospirillum griseum]